MTYKSQFRKLLLFIQDEYLPQLPRDSSTAPSIARLELLLQNYAIKQSIEPPKGSHFT